jgi:hypothetical protein
VSGFSRTGPGQARPMSGVLERHEVTTINAELAKPAENCFR